MATGHTLGTDLNVEYTEAKGRAKGKLVITVDNIDELVETAKMKMACSTSGFIELPFTLGDKVAKLNLQFGINKPKSEHWPS